MLSGLFLDLIWCIVEYTTPQTACARKWASNFVLNKRSKSILDRPPDVWDTNGSLWVSTKLCLVFKCDTLKTSSLISRCQCRYCTFVFLSAVFALMWQISFRHFKIIRSFSWPYCFLLFWLLFRCICSRSLYIGSCHWDQCYDIMIRLTRLCLSFAVTSALLCLQSHDGRVSIKGSELETALAIRQMTITSMKLY